MWIATFDLYGCTLPFFYVVTDSFEILSRLLLFVNIFNPQQR
jgi:hypothetical protein